MLKRIEQPHAFDLLTFLEGRTRADGAFEDRFGRLRRRFTVDLLGRMDGEAFVLDETFDFDDGTREERSWRLLRDSGGGFSGTCPDSSGPAVGQAGPGFATMSSKLRQKIGTRQVTLHFDDLYIPLDRTTVLNRSCASKWGLRVGQAMILFRKAA